MDLVRWLHYYARTCIRTFVHLHTHFSAIDAFLPCLLMLWSVQGLQHFSSVYLIHIDITSCVSLHGTFEAEFDLQGRCGTTNWHWNRREDLLWSWWNYWRESLLQMSRLMYCQAICPCVYFLAICSFIWLEFSQLQDQNLSLQIEEVLVNALNVLCIKLASDVVCR